MDTSPVTPREAFDRFVLRQLSELTVQELLAARDHCWRPSVVDKKGYQSSARVITAELRRRGVA